MAIKLVNKNGANRITILFIQGISCAFSLFLVADKIARHSYDKSQTMITYHSFVVFKVLKHCFSFALMGVIIAKKYKFVLSFNKKSAWNDGIFTSCFLEGEKN